MRVLALILVVVLLPSCVTPTRGGSSAGDLGGAFEAAGLLVGVTLVVGYVVGRKRNSR